MANHTAPPTPTTHHGSNRRYSTPFKSVVRKTCAHCARAFIAPIACTDEFCGSDCCATAAYLKAIHDAAMAACIGSNSHNDTIDKLTKPWNQAIKQPVDEKKSSPMQIPFKKASRA